METPQDWIVATRNELDALRLQLMCTPGVKLLKYNGFFVPEDCQEV